MSLGNHRTIFGKKIKIHSGGVLQIDDKKGLDCYQGPETGLSGVCQMEVQGRQEGQGSILHQTVSIEYMPKQRKKLPNIILFPGS